MAETYIDLTATAPTGANDSSPVTYEHVVWPYILFLPFMCAVAFYAQVKKGLYRLFGADPRFNCWLADGISLSGRAVRDGAASWRALDTVYNFRNGRGNNAVVRAIDWFYMHIRSAQAPRNRLIMAKEHLRQTMRDVYKTIVAPGEPVRILSLAAGSAQGVIEVMAEMEAKGIPSEAMLVDIDPTAIVHANSLARKHGIEDRVKAILGDVLRFDRLIAEFKPDIIEMMGLTDYLRTKLAVTLFTKIRRVLKRGGYFYTSNVHPNPEAYFLRHITNWVMIYRTKGELADLFIDAKFPNPVVVSEPHGFQSFAYAQKLD